MALRRLQRHWISVMLLGGMAGLCGCAPAPVELADDARIEAVSTGRADVASQPADEPPLLRWRFREGEVYRWSPHWEINLHMTQGAESNRAEAGSTWDFDIKPMSATDKDALLHFALVRIRERSKVHLRMLDGDEEENEPILTEYDSLTDGNGGEMSSYHSLLETTFMVQIDSFGKIQSIKVDPDLKALLGLQRTKQITSLMFDPHGLNSLYFNGLFALPENPLSVGDESTHSITSPAPITIAYFQMHFTTKYAGIVEQDGLKLDRFTITPNFEFAENLGTFIRFDEQKTSGEMFFDRSQGLLVSSGWQSDTDVIISDGAAKGSIVMKTSATLGKKSAEDEP